MNCKRLFNAYRIVRGFDQYAECHTFSGKTKQIAEYPNLENQEYYTGNSLRRSSVSMLVKGRADLLTLKVHGGWRSSTVAEGYI